MPRLSARSSFTKKQEGAVQLKQVEAIMNSSMMSGVGVERDVALRGAFSQNQRTYTTVVRRESRRIPLGLGPTVKH